MAVAAVARGLRWARMIPMGAPISPFESTPVGALPVLNLPLAEAQAQALRENGLQITDQPPAGEPCLLFSDRAYFNAAALRALLAAGPGQARITDQGLWQTIGPLQPAARPGLQELAVVLDGGGPVQAHAAALLAGSLPEAPLDLRLRDLGPELPKPHPAMAHALRPVKVGEAVLHTLSHWSHLLRANQLALGALGEAARARFEASGPLRRAVEVLRVLARAGGVHPAKIAAALTEQGPGCTIHPTASVEACLLGAGVEIGAYSVVRGCVLGPGVKIEEHATVLSSVLGERAHVGRYGFSHLNLLMREARLSCGGGYQASVFGEGCFMAWGATALDMSFGREVMVEQGGALVASGHHLLGVAVGPRAVVGNRVRLQHGVSVPADAVLVGPADDLLRGWGPSPTDAGPHRAVMGQAEPLRRRG